MSIVLPEDQEATARKRAEEHGFESPEAYLAWLVQVDEFDAFWATLTPEERAAHEETERLLDEAIASGPAIPADEASRRIRRQIEERRARGAASQSPP
jgi:hypothetical protein